MRVRAGVQVSRMKLYTHIHLNYFRVEFYLVSKKEKKKKEDGDSKIKFARNKKNERS